MALMDAFQGNLSEERVAHLLRRATFAPTRANIQAWRGRTAQDLVQTLLADKPVPQHPIDPANRSTWHDKAYLFLQDATYNNILKSWWTGQMLNDGVSLREKMTLFWHNLFVSSYPAVLDARYMYRQNTLLRRFALGNVRTLVKEITTDPAMLRYLNGNTNTKNSINENYARELQELFTIGKGAEVAPGNYTNYTEQDVRAAARVLTGWVDNSIDGSVSFMPNNHDTTNKEFSAAYQNTVIRGRTGEDGAAETDELLDMIFRQAETARFFCRKLYVWFVNAEIDATIEREVITELAATLRASKWEIIPVLELLFKSQHFFDATNLGSMVKHPIDLTVSTVNYLRQHFSPAIPTADSDLAGWYNFCEWLWKSADAQEMGILNHPNVAGWKAYYQRPLYDKLWINISTLAARNAFTDQLFDGVEITTQQGTKQFAVDSILFARDVCTNPGNGDDLVEKLSRYLVGVTLTPEQRLYLMDEVLAPGYSNARGAWDMNWGFFTSDPTDMGKRQAVQSRIDNLAKFVLQMPEAHLV